MKCLLAAFLFLLPLSVQAQSWTETGMGDGPGSVTINGSAITITNHSCLNGMLTEPLCARLYSTHLSDSTEVSVRIDSVKGDGNQIGEAAYLLAVVDTSSDTSARYGIEFMGRGDVRVIDSDETNPVDSVLAGGATIPRVFTLERYDGASDDTLRFTVADTLGNVLYTWDDIKTLADSIFVSLGVANRDASADSVTTGYTRDLTFSAPEAPDYLPAPSSIVASSPNYEDQVECTWSQVATAESYSVELYNDTPVQVDSVLVNDEGGGGSDYTFSGNTWDDTYYCKVTTTGGLADSSATFLLKQDAPTLSSVTSASATSLLAMWTNPPGASIDSNKIYVDTVLDTTIATNTSFTITGLTTDQEYDINVSAKNAGGNSDQSNTVAGTPVAPSVPDAPVISAVNNGGATSLIVNWTNPVGQGVDSNRVYVDAVLDTTISVRETFTVTGLTTDVQVAITVSARNTNGWGSQSTGVNGTPTDIVVPDAPANLVAIDSLQNEVSLTWDRSDNAWAYVVFRREQDIVGTPDDNVPYMNFFVFDPDSSWIDSGGRYDVVNNTLYTYRVAAVNQLGQYSDFSNQVTARPVANVLAGPEVTTTVDVGDDTVSVTMTYGSLAGMSNPRLLLYSTIGNRGSGANGTQVAAADTAGMLILSDSSPGASPYVYEHTGMGNRADRYYTAFIRTDDGLSDWQNNSHDVIPLPGTTLADGRPWPIWGFNTQGHTNNTIEMWWEQIRYNQCVTTNVYPSCPHDLDIDPPDSIRVYRHSVPLARTEKPDDHLDKVIAFRVGETPRTYTDTGLTNDVQYCYSIVAINDAGVGDFSVWRCAKPKADWYPGTTFAEDFNVTGDPVGGGPGYSDIITQGTDTIATLADLQAKAIGGGSPATSGDTLFFEHDTVINTTSCTPCNLDFNDGVVIAGDRGRDMGDGTYSLGALIRSDSTINSGGIGNRIFYFNSREDIRITGLRIQGPNSHLNDQGHGRTNNLKDHTCIQFNVNRGEFDNNELRACHTYGLYMSVWDSLKVHHNYVHHVRRQGIGYGISHSGSGVHPAPWPYSESYGNFYLNNRHSWEHGGHENSSIGWSQWFADPSYFLHTDRHSSGNAAAGGGRTNLYRSVARDTVVLVGGIGYSKPFTQAPEVRYYHNWYMTSLDYINVAGANLSGWYWHYYDPNDHWHMDDDGQPEGGGESWYNGYGVVQPTGSISSNGASRVDGTVTFSPSVTHPDNHSIRYFKWDTGDSTGRFNEFSGWKYSYPGGGSYDSTITHTYLKPGKFGVTLWPNDEYGVRGVIDGIQNVYPPADSGDYVLSIFTNDNYVGWESGKFDVVIGINTTELCRYDIAETKGWDHCVRDVSSVLKGSNDSLWVHVRTMEDNSSSTEINGVWLYIDDYHGFGFETSQGGRMETAQWYQGTAWNTLNWYIDNADATAETFTFNAIDLTWFFPTGREFDVDNSTCNDNEPDDYTVLSSTYTGGNTVVTVSDVPCDTDDGYVKGSESSSYNRRRFVRKSGSHSAEWTVPSNASLDEGQMIGFYHILNVGPVRPTNVQAAAGGAGELVVTWTESANNCRVWGSDTNDSGFSVLTTGETDQSYTETGLGASKTRYYVVDCTDGVYSNWSATATGTTDP